MSNTTKVLLKINRYEVYVGENDWVLDNGSCIQTSVIVNGYHLRMSKKLFGQLKTCNFLIKDEILTQKAGTYYGSSFAIYYKFNIQKMIEFGYETN